MTESDFLSACGHDPEISAEAWGRFRLVKSLSMSDEKHDLLKLSTKDDRRDYNFMMGMSVLATETLIDSAPWNHRLRWWAWKRWEKGWMFWTPPKRVLKDASRGFVTNLRARVPRLGRR